MLGGILRWLWFVVLLTTPALAQDAPGRRVLLLDLDEPTAESSSSVSALRVHLSDLPVQLDEVRPNAGERSRIQMAIAIARQRSADAVVWIEVGESGMSVYWVDPASGRGWYRRLSGDAKHAVVLREQAAIVARRGIEALLELGRIDEAPVVEESSPEPAQTPASAPVVGVDERSTTTPSRSRVVATIAYAGNQFAHDVGWQHGLAVSLATTFTEHWFARLSYTIYPAIEITRPDVTAQLERHPSRLLAGYQFGDTLRFRAELGPFVDLTQRATIRASAETARTPDSRRWAWGMSAVIGADLELAGPLRLVLIAGGDVVANHFRYLADDATRQVALEPSRFRPTVEAGLVLESW